MTTEMKCAIMAAVLMFGVGMHGAARTDFPESWFGYAVAACGLTIVAIGLWCREP